MPADPFTEHLTALGMGTKASYSCTEAARILGVSPSTISRMLDSGTITPYIQSGSARHLRRPTYLALKGVFRHFGEAL